MRVCICVVDNFHARMPSEFFATGSRVINVAYLSVVYFRRQRLGIPETHMYIRTYKKVKSTWLVVSRACCKKAFTQHPLKASEIQSLLLASSKDLQDAHLNKNKGSNLKFNFGLLGTHLYTYNLLFCLLSAILQFCLIASHG